MLSFVFKKRRRTLLQAGDRINRYSSPQINASANANASATIARRGGRRDFTYYIIVSTSMLNVGPPTTAATIHRGATRIQPE